MYKISEKFQDKKGVTLISLVVTIIVLLILASIATYSGISVIKQAKLTQFTTEMKTMQGKINDLYDKYSNNGKIEIEGTEYVGTEILNIGKDLSVVQEQANKVFQSSASGITDKTGYKYFDKNLIKTFNVENVEGEFFVNVEKRSIVSYDGIEYEDKMYYTLEQLPNSLYNVEYTNKNANGPTFDLSCDNWTNGKSNIKISNIKYDKGNISTWQVKYKLEGENYWKTTEDYSFFVDTPGIYIIKLVNNDIESVEKQIEAVKSNGPNLVEGMTATTFKLPEGNNKGQIIQGDSSAFDNNLWYDYGNKKWANSTTKDGSMWVWIPRFAYKITYNNKNDKSKGGKIDVKFLIGTSDQYYDNSGKIKVAKRAKSSTEGVDTTTDYYVHPAFTDESDIKYANGGWDRELTGIWVSKFEAGFASGNNNAPVKASSVNYTQTTAWVPAEEGETSSDSAQPARNWLDGIYGTTKTSIKYPTFQSKTYSMNYINVNDAYNISRALTESGNIYGLSSSTDSHLMKNSEWGAVAYLSHSKYGTNGVEPYINNINLNNSTQSVYAVTGVTTGTINAGAKTTTIEKVNGTTGNTANDGIYTWDQKEGQKASTTLNMYGVYDFNGGTWERTTGYIANGSENLKTYGASVAYDGDKLKTESTKYTTVYPHGQEDSSNGNNSSEINYNKNMYIFGDAIRETSTSGIGETSWNDDASKFFALGDSLINFGGAYWDSNSSGLFCFCLAHSSSIYNGSFRTVLIAV